MPCCHSALPSAPAPALLLALCPARLPRPFPLCPGLGKPGAHACLCCPPPVHLSPACVPLGLLGLSLLSGHLVPDTQAPVLPFLAPRAEALS